MNVVKKICHDCPFRRSAPAGWLGANTPVEFARASLGENGIGCHTTFDQELPDDEWAEEEAAAPRCRGALVFMRNNCKLPREARMAALVKTVEADRENVFATVGEFLAHHTAHHTRKPLRPTGN